MVNPNRFYTYAYLREDKTPYYIGKGCGRRIYQSSGRPCSKPNKNRIIFLKKNITEEEAFKHEIYMIAVFGRKDLGTGILHNRTDGGDGISGYKHNKNVKQKISDIMKGEYNHFYGKNHSQETKIKMSEAKKGKYNGDENPMFGKNHSQETKIKMSEAKKGKYNGDENPMFGKNHSQEVKDKIGEANRGKTFSNETRRKMSETKKGDNNPAYGKKWWNNGQTQKRSKECPGEGWVLGLGHLNNRHKGT